MWVLGIESGSSVRAVSHLSSPYEALNYGCLIWWLRFAGIPVKSHSASIQGQVVFKLGHHNAKGMQESANGFPGGSGVFLK